MTAASETQLLLSGKPYLLTSRAPAAGIKDSQMIVGHRGRKSATTAAFVLKSGRNHWQDDR